MYCNLCLSYEQPQHSLPSKNASAEIISQCLQIRRGSMFISASVPDFPADDPRHTSNNLALSLFFSRSILTPRRLQTVTGFWEELPFFIIQHIGFSSSPSSSSSLPLITSACAAAAYGIRHKSDSALIEARAAYDVAIEQLSVNVSAPPPTSTALADSILSVFLCIFFEVSLFHGMI